MAGRGAGIGVRFRCNLLRGVPMSDQTQLFLAILLCGLLLAIIAVVLLWTAQSLFMRQGSSMAYDALALAMALVALVVMAASGTVVVFAFHVIIP